MGNSVCPNTKSDEWKKLLAELNDNRLVAMRAFRENSGEIPDIDSEIVARLKPVSKLNLGEFVKVVKKNDVEEEDYYETTDGKRINRVGSFINLFSSAKMRSTDFIQEKADRLWLGKDKDKDKITNYDGVAESYDEYITRRRDGMKIGAAKGKVLHLAIQQVLNSNLIEENTKRINKIIENMRDENGKVPFYWEWIYNTDTKKNKDGVEVPYYSNIEKIFDNLGINYFKRTDSAFDDMLKDQISTEVSVSITSINLAGTIDLLVEHADGTHSIVDWKTGKNFSGRTELEDLFLMKYGDQGTKEITDNFRNRAKIQLAMYAIMLKANNPGMRFRDLQIGWIPNEYIIQNRDVDANVNVAAFIPMIEQMMSDKSFLEKNGFDKDIKSKLLDMDKGIFNPTEYSSNTLTNDIYDEIVTEGKSPQQILDDKIARLRYITTRNMDFNSLSQKDQAESIKLSDDITQMLSEGNTLITKDSYHDMNLMERYLGNYSEVSHPAVQAWKSFKNSRERIALFEVDKKIKIFRSLLRPVMKEIDKEQSIVNVFGNKAYDYDKVYGWAYVKTLDTNDTGKERERYLTAKEKDPELKERWNNLSPAKKKFLTYVNSVYSEYFIGKNAFMNQTATYDNAGNALSQLDLYNKKKATLDKRIYYDGFFFKVPITDEEIILREGKGSYLKGLLNKHTLGRMLYNSATMFRESEYENWFDSSSAMPVKFLGNEYIDVSQNYTRNMEFTFEKAVSEMERTMQLQDVYSIGISLRNKLNIEKDPQSPLEPMYKNLVSFLDAKLIHDVQKKSTTIRWMRTKKVRMPMYNPKTGKTEMYPISIDKMLQALRSYGSATTMWAKPFQGMGNGVLAIGLTQREGMKGSIAGIKILGVSADVIDTNFKTNNRASAEYFKDFVPNAIKGDPRKSKLYLIAKKIDYFGNNFEYHLNSRESISERNKYINKGPLYAPYSIPEEFVSLKTMAATLMYLKNNKTGKSLYDSYEKFEILDDKGEGTGEYDVRWAGGIRGVIKSGSGDLTRYEEFTELTSKEIAKIKKVHERLQGNYRREEALAIEVTALGKTFLQLKRYFPRLILNALHRKRIEMDLGAYKPVLDENGTQMMRNEDGDQMPIYEWIARTTEGRWLTVGKYLVNVLTLGKMAKENGWKSLNDEQKTNLIEAALTLGEWMAFYGIYLTAFGDTDDDDTSKKLWKQYVVDNLTQQYNIIDILRTAKTAGTPIAMAKLIDFVTNGTSILFSGANYAIGNDDLALNKNKELRGWNKFAKDVPFLTSYKDIVNKIKNDKTGMLSWSDWLYGGVRLK